VIPRRVIINDEPIGARNDATSPVSRFRVAVNLVHQVKAPRRRNERTVPALGDIPGHVGERPRVHDIRDEGGQPVAQSPLKRSNG
jgi:hypothetical protein